MTATKCLAVAATVVAAMWSVSAHAQTQPSNQPAAVQTAIAHATAEMANCYAQHRPDCPIPTSTGTVVPTATPAASVTGTPGPTDTPTPAPTDTPTAMPADDASDGSQDDPDAIPTVGPLQYVDAPGDYVPPPAVITVVVSHVEQVIVPQDHDHYIIVTATPTDTPEAVAAVVTNTPVPTDTPEPISPTATYYPTLTPVAEPTIAATSVSTQMPVAAESTAVAPEITPPVAPTPIQHVPAAAPLLVGIDTLRERYGLMLMLIGLHFLASTAQIALPT